MNAEFQTIPLKSLRESSVNPRSHFNADALKELEASIRSHGVLTPLLVRPNNGHFEIAAGHRRFRAAKAAELESVPAVVREMTDTELLEVVTIENLQREDVHPLDEAAGYRALLKVGYDVQRIADRVGRSVKYVYDRMKLTELTKEAKDLFFDGKITAGHAILLARLKKDEQERIIGGGSGRADVVGGLFTHDHADLFKEEDEDETLKKFHGLKPVSVRELASYIDDHVKFDAKTTPDPLLFPEAAAALTVAKEKADKVIPITHDHYVQPDARDDNRVFGPRSWKRADGEPARDPWSGRTEKSKTCDRSGLGVVVVGGGRGETLRVCVSKACTTHWAKKATKKKGESSTDYAARDSAQHKRYEAEERRRQEERRRWAKAAPAIAAALAKAITEAKGIGVIAQLVLDHCEPDAYRASKAKILEFAPTGKSADQVLRRAAFMILAEITFDEFTGPRDLPKPAKALGVDVAAILEKEAPAEKPEKPKPAVQTSGKKKAKKRA